MTKHLKTKRSKSLKHEGDFTCIAELTHTIKHADECKKGKATQLSTARGRA